MHRLPGSPPGEPVLLEEVLSFPKDHQGQKGEKASIAMVRPHLEDPHSSRSGMPQKGKKDNLVERSLATVCEANQKALVMAATLKEEIERLSHTWNCSETRARSKSRDHQGSIRGDQKRRCCQVQFEDPLPLTASLSQRQGLGKREPLAKTLIWRSHWNLGQRWHHS